MRDAEYFYDVLWYTNDKVTVAFSTTFDEVINNPGRWMTITTIVINNKSTGEFITRTGLAICSPKDTFDIIKGRRLSTQRAINTYPERAIRTHLWSWYWTAVKNANKGED